MWARQVLAVVRKDLLIEARSRANFNAMLFFAGLVVLIFSFALGADSRQLRASAGGVLWLAFIFAGTLAFSRAYQIEAENGAIDGLLLVARSRTAIYCGKVAATSIFMLVIEALTVPFMAVLYSLDLWRDSAGLLLTGLLGTLGYAAIGTLYGALTMRLRAREVMLPLLMLPVSVPVVLAAVNATTALVAGSGDVLRWLEVLVAFNVVFVTAGLLLYDYAVEE